MKKLTAPQTWGKYLGRLEHGTMVVSHRYGKVKLLSFETGRSACGPQLTSLGDERRFDQLCSLSYGKLP